jgi:hypothetical protein
MGFKEIKVRFEKRNMCLCYTSCWGTNQEQMWDETLAMTVSRVRCIGYIKPTFPSTISVLINREDKDRHGTRNVGFIHTPDAAECPRGLRRTKNICLSEKISVKSINYWLQYRGQRRSWHEQLSGALPWLSTKYSPQYHPVCCTLPLMITHHLQLAASITKY